METGADPAARHAAGRCPVRAGGAGLSGGGIGPERAAGAVGGRSAPGGGRAGGAGQESAGTGRTLSAGAGLPARGPGAAAPAPQGNASGTVLVVLGAYHGGQPCQQRPAGPAGGSRRCGACGCTRGPGLAAAGAGSGGGRRAAVPGADAGVSAPLGQPGGRGQAVLFALLHGDAPACLSALLSGLALGLCAETSGSLLPGMVFHLYNNNAGVAEPDRCRQRMGSAAAAVWPARRRTGGMGDKARASAPPAGYRGRCSDPLPRLRAGAGAAGDADAARHIYMIYHEGEI